MSTTLWVDDEPNNNRYKRQALEALGVSLVLAQSTDEALEKLSHQKFDAIISDMGRPPDPSAGYTLLDKLRAAGNRTRLNALAIFNKNAGATSRFREYIGRTMDKVGNFQ